MLLFRITFSISTQNRHEIYFIMLAETRKGGKWGKDGIGGSVKGYIPYLTRVFILLGDTVSGKERTYW